MRPSALAVLIICAGSALAPTTAAAVTWDPPVGLPADPSATGLGPWPGPAVARANGDAVAVSTAGGSYGDPFTTRIDALRRGQPGGFTTLRDWQLLDTATDAAGMYVLGVEKGSRLVLLHAAFGASPARPRTRWSAPLHGTTAAAVSVRGDGAVTVMWLPRGKAAPRGTAAPRMVRSRDGRRFGRVRALSGLLRAADRRGGPNGLDLVDDDRGRTVLALSTLTSKPYPNRGRLILASGTWRSGFRVRQRVAGPTGTPTLTKGPGGRLGLLVVDDPTSGGDCEAGGPRRLWGLAREPRGVRFRAPRRLLTGTACYQPPQQLVAGPGGRFAVVWGTGYFGSSEGSEVWLATSAPGSGFSAPTPAGGELVFSGAGYDPSGTLAIAAWRNGGPPSPVGTPGRIPHVQLRPPGGSPEPFDAVASDAEADQATVGIATHPVVFSVTLLPRQLQLQLQLGHR